MSRRRSSVAKVFGAEGTQAAIEAFSQMDSDGVGAVSFERNFFFFFS